MTSPLGWILPGRLAGMGRPAADDWPALKAAGVGAVLTLTGRPPPGDPAAAGLVSLHLPVPDFGTPTDEELARAVRWIAARIAEDRAVLVHCQGGIGRTGTLLAAYLVSTGLDPDEAIRRVRSVRPGSIETPAQERLVHRFARDRA